MSNIKDKLAKFINYGEIDAAYHLINEHIGEETNYLQHDAEYCVLAASAYMSADKYETAFDIISIGLLTDNKNYELYLMLGEYYERKDLDQALLCYYQAYLYCENEDDRNIINGYIENVRSLGAQLNNFSIVIVCKDQAKELERCLMSISETIVYGLSEIVIVDNSKNNKIQQLSEGIDNVLYIHNDTDINYTASLNQGIKLCSNYNDILLLDADVVLLDNCLFYLMLGLYSDDKNGIIGGFTNDFIAEQKIGIGTTDLGEAAQRAIMINNPIREACETDVTISDYFMYIKRSVIDGIGIFDEQNFPCGYEDKDYCIRAHKAGFDVKLCFNSYCLKTEERYKRYDSLEIVKKRGKEASVKKWNCDIDYSNYARTELIEMITATKDKPIEVLELGCAAGCSLYRIRRLWPNSKVHGVEYVENIAQIGATMADIIQGDVESMIIPYNKKQFDYIICADVLEHLRDPQATIERFIPYLKDDGHFLISLPNVRQYAVVKLLALYGRFDYMDYGILDKTHLKFFTKDTAIEMLKKAGLIVERIERYYNSEPEENEFIDTLSQFFDVKDKDEMRVYQYYFLAKKA